MVKPRILISSRRSCTSATPFICGGGLLLLGGPVESVDLWLCVFVLPLVMHHTLSKYHTIGNSARLGATAVVNDL